ncbi:universal stress protein [Tunturiibacter gelidiferens]|uniref:universal stress protein n=1 Tax=Tunturiibacter gelidiferens TaxID=3069689 RepID=UPI003D9B3B02
MPTRSISEQIQGLRQQNIEFGLRRLVVAYDASQASERALSDAIFLAQRFHSEVLVVRVLALTETTHEENAQNHADLKTVTSRLAGMSIRSREIVRVGIVGDTLFNICCEENADLLLLGAYGYGPRDRRTLGSTAEYLLRAIPCPVLTYGPSVSSSLSSVSDKGPILVPISLPCDRVQLRMAIAITKLFGAKIELLHVEDPTRRRFMKSKTAQDLEHQCESLALQLRHDGVQLEWSLRYGKPDELIDARSREVDSPFILMPLKRGDRLSSIASDNVAAHVIRCSRLAIMTYGVE